MMLLDIGWLSLGVVWLYKFYMIVDIGEAREIMLGKSEISSTNILLTYFHS